MNGRGATSRRVFLGRMAVMAAGPSMARTLRAACSDAGPPFAPEIGVCTSPEHAALLQEAGATYVEASVRGWLVPDKPDGAFEEKARLVQPAAVPVRSANGFLPGSLKCVGPEADHAAVLAYAGTAFARASRLGIATIVFGSSGARSIPDGFERRRAELQLVALLGKMALLAETHGVTVALEPLQRDETNFINTVPEAADLVDAVQHPNVRLVADVFHMLRMDDPPQGIRDAGRFVHHVHIAEKAARTPPGVQGDDFRPYLQALKDIGYRGRVSIECRWSDMTVELPRAVATLRDQMGALA